MIQFIKTLPTYLRNSWTKEAFYCHLWKFLLLFYSFYLCSNLYIHLNTTNINITKQTCWFSNGFQSIITLNSVYWFRNLERDACEINVHPRALHFISIINVFNSTIYLYIDTRIHRKKPTLPRICGYLIIKYTKQISFIYSVLVWYAFIIDLKIENVSI